jgi:hypothetical protein
MNTIYFLTSLPKSGTTSLCRMADMCGLKSLHVLKNVSLISALNEGYNFYADTPFYSPEFLIGLLEFEIQKKYNIKFIYSHRINNDHKKSLEKMYLNWNIPKPTNKISLLDHILHNKIKKYDNENHHLYIKTISTIYNINLLNYNFSEGWASFCEFINKPIPKDTIPHLNKSCLN